MRKSNTHWGVIATATLTIAGALIAPQAEAKAKAKAAAEAYAAPSTNSRVDALEAQLQALQSEISSLRAAQNKPSTESAKVQELDEWAQSIKSKPAKSDSKDNMVFFRGGYSHSNDNRGGDLAVNAFPGGLNGDILVGAKSTDKDAWYFGAGFDWSLNDNLFGMMNGTGVLAELMFDYKELSGKTNSVLTGQSVTTNQLTLAASPKIKFMKGSAFRPWLIPAGFEISVISPPSGAVTVLNPGIMFGAGADYKIWKDLYVGADARYHYSADNIDGVDTDGVTAGGYIGIGF